MLLGGIQLWQLILLWMVTLVPQSPWRESYVDTASAIADTVQAHEPLYRNDETRIQTAATLVALARFESSFNPDAVGDNGASHGLYQQQRFGTLSDVREATKVALTQIRISFRICHGRDRAELLAWYAAGNEGCSNVRGLRQSRNRMNLAFRLAGE